MRLFRPHLMRQEIRLLNEVRAPKTPLQTPNVYEFRNLFFSCSEKSRIATRSRAQNDDRSGWPAAPPERSAGFDTCRLIGILFLTRCPRWNRV